MKHFIQTISILLIMMVNNIALSANDDIKHKVLRGETLESIASQYKISVSQLIDANPIAQKRIAVGMTLIIPSNKTVLIDSIKAKQSDSAINITPIDSSALPEKNSRDVSHRLSDYDSLSESDFNNNNFWLSGGLPFDNFFKHGILEFEGNISGPNWNNIGAYLSLGWHLGWNPKFDVGSALFSIGPSYTINLDNHIKILLPVAVLAAVSFENTQDEDSGKIKEKKRITWEGKIAPKFCYKKFGFGLAGYFGDGDPTFAMVLSVAI